MNSYLQVILGLGFVIFVHELGHFLLAKWNGVKVEKFSIGFGTPLLAWRRGVGLRFLSGAPIPEPPKLVESDDPDTPRPHPAPAVGETEYAIAAIPLGGFVKMLGESPEEESKITDPRAYPNKSVGARMAIISAGVIMNVIFGLICFAYVYRNGVTEIPPLVGLVQPASPAYLAGIRPGDEILAINNKRPVDFHDLKIRSALSGQGEALRLEMKRPGEPNPYVVLVEPRSEPGLAIPMIGLGASHDTVLDDTTPFRAPPGMTESAENVNFRPGDRIVAVGPADGQPELVETPMDLNRLLTKYRAVPIQVVVRGKPPEKAAPEAKSDSPVPVQAEPERAVVVPVNRFLDFGFRLELGPVEGIRKDSPAERAGFRVGDQIVEVDGLTDLDPLRLPFLVHDRAGEPIDIVVSRTRQGVPRGERITLQVTPEAVATWVNQPTMPSSPLDLPALGLAYRVEPKVVAVTPGSPADRAGLRPGDALQAVRLSLPPSPEDSPGSQGQTEELPLEGPDSVTWNYVFLLVQSQPGVTLALTVPTRSLTLNLTPTPVDDWFNPERGLRLVALERTLPPQGIWAAMRHGIDEVWENAVSVYFMIRGLIQGRISRKMVAGPIGIFQMGSQAATVGFHELVRFLGMLSINLAVINFLPIPPLDGGQMIFLIAEKVRGRPLPESALAAATYAGLLFVLSLMGFVIFQDSFELIKQNWPW